MFDLFCGRLIRRGRIGALPAAFNPPTVAHLALAAAAARQHSLDQVVFVLPRALPHKDFGGATFDDRVAMLRAALRDHPGHAAASCPGGLFFQIAGDLRQACGPEVAIAVLCGRDAAERSVAWDYGDGPSIADQLREFELLAGFRRGRYEPPSELSDRIRTVALPQDLDEVSSSRLRRAVASGADWEHWTPAPAATVIRRGVRQDCDAQAAWARFSQ